MCQYVCIIEEYSTLVGSTVLTEYSISMKATFEFNQSRRSSVVIMTLGYNLRVNVPTGLACTVVSIQSCDVSIERVPLLY
jgi:hypothetical protein